MKNHFIENVEFKNFKCFKELHVKNLKRVNLISGKNNIGKTSFMEGLELFLSSKDIYEVLSSIHKMVRRRQYNNRQSNKYLEFDIIYQNNSTMEINSSNSKLKIEYFDEFDDEIYFEIYDSKKNIYKNLKTISSSLLKSWQITNKIKIFENLDKKEESIIEDKNIEEVEEKATTDIYGTGELIITKFSFLDENLEEKFIFTVDESIIFRVNYKCFEEIYNPVFVVEIYKPDGTTITQLIDKQRGFGIDKIFNNSFVDFKIDNLKIGKGEYLVSVAVFHDIDLTNPIEQKTYCLHDRKYKFKIEQPYGLNMDLGMIYQDFEVKYGSEYE